MTRTERDKAIVEGFRSGVRRKHLAYLFGLSTRRITQIAAEHGVQRYPAEQMALGLCKGGRPRDAKLDRVRHDRRYIKLRRIMGAAYAREAMGVAA